eukprot:CAMPEP_0198333160 /NCGR_PEP_ID=MMETSP1450-20131203/18771_1 /TAXON_ID=753684 ORGANISM="Madagascaria erythrocladiodes, Strain CCMP3234" /NCGR_SAMPLE_ID=MMETSP1450 /ASSEMBLY_ACC=CAM_ASM_001115 /LENGTH=402 /DNA_ID=CAMNT_0044037665 /DNA_START=88 /DNA_END=1296 /DNA_ORIENTATION=+
MDFEVDQLPIPNFTLPSFTACKRQLQDSKLVRQPPSVVIPADQLALPIDPQSGATSALSQPCFSLDGRLVFFLAQTTAGERLACVLVDNGAWRYSRLWEGSTASRSVPYKYWTMATSAADEPKSTGVQFLGNSGLLISGSKGSFRYVNLNSETAEMGEWTEQRQKKVQTHRGAIHDFAIGKKHPTVLASGGEDGKLCFTDTERAFGSRFSHGMPSTRRLALFAEYEIGEPIRSVRTSHFQVFSCATDNGNIHLVDLRMKSQGSPCIAFHAGKERLSSHALYIDDNLIVAGFGNALIRTFDLRSLGSALGCFSAQPPQKEITNVIFTAEGSRSFVTFGSPVAVGWRSEGADGNPGQLYTPSWSCGLGKDTETAKYYNQGRFSNDGRFLAMTDNRNQFSLLEIQ